jgi:hypothetical protein
MPFDPNIPMPLAPLDADVMRGQLNSLKALSDLGAVPVGCMLPYLKDLTNTPALPSHWAELNGQTLNDPESPYDGVLLPDLNVFGRFLRGGLNSGGVGGIDTFATALADNASLGTPQNFVTVDFSPGAQPFPPYYTVVWVLRVK